MYISRCGVALSRGYSSDGRTEGGCVLRMAVTPWTQRVAASNNSEFMFSKVWHGTRICTRQVRTGDSVSDRAHSIAGRRDHERSSLLSPSLTSGHGTRSIPACPPDYVRALLAARGYWSSALFLRGVGAPPFASCGCRTRNLGTGKTPCRGQSYT